MGVKYIRLLDYEQSQHYHNHIPGPWFKMFTQPLSTERFYRLSEAERWHLVGLRAVAHETRNWIPLRTDYLKWKLNLKTPLNVRKLVTLGYIAIADEAAKIAENGNGNGRLSPDAAWAHLLESKEEITEPLTLLSISLAGGRVRLLTAVQTGDLKTVEQLRKQFVSNYQKHLSEMLK